MINSINFLNFTKTYNPFKTRNNQTTNYISNIHAPKLMPLAHDCVSFTSKKKANLNKSLYDAFDNIEVCKQVSENAKRVENKLGRTLKDALKKQVFSDKTNPHGAILNITTRAKTGNSIREKLASELEYAITEDKSKVFNPNNSEEIKAALGDIIGARITLRKSDTKETSKIIDALIEEVKAGRLRITKIENYEPKNCDSSLRYFNRSDLERLRNVANEYRKPNQPEVVFKPKSEKDSGYMALHIDVDLSDDDLPTKFNNYKGEIQIIGRDVEKLKEVEDFLYKLHKGMTIRGGHSAYNAFSDYYTKFSQLYEQYPHLKEDMQLYTSRAYAYQRKKEPIHSKNYSNPRIKYQDNLPTIAQCNMQGKIPEELDFNTLAKIKKLSDDLYELTAEAA